MMFDVTRATSYSPDVAKEVHRIFDYQQWNTSQVEKGRAVKIAVIELVKVIIEKVPPGPDRSTALRKLRELRMDCNSAITHNGAY